MVLSKLLRVARFMSKVLYTRHDNEVVKITLNNPARNNAFDDEIISSLISILEDIEHSDNIKLVVLDSSGKHFSAGADLNWMKRMSNCSHEENLKDASMLTTMLQKLNNLKYPTLAVIKGAAFGGGVGLISCCDIALASENSIFSLSEVKVGLIPATISPYVINAIGARNARRLFTSGERFDSNIAKQINLVHEIAKEEDLEKRISYFINHFKQNGPQAVIAAKKIVLDIFNKEIDDSVISHTCEVISALRTSKEGREGVTAFLEKRNPNW